MKLRGAEANLTRKEGKLIKTRVEKKYRVKELDLRIRKLRAKSEWKILRHLKMHCVKCPQIYNFDEANFAFELEKLDGKLLEKVLKSTSKKKAGKLCKLAGVQIAKMHLCKVTHGDCTTSNFIVTPKGEVFVIDFGLSEMTRKTEERALDLQLFKKTVTPKQFNSFLKGYVTEMGIESKPVLAKLEEVEKRGRYKKR